MSNHKRKRPKHQRGGCIFCKYWKDERGKNGFTRQKLLEKKAREKERADFLDEDSWEDIEYELKRGG